MLAEERRLRIIELLREQKSVEIGELSELFAVAQETIRRDLKRLEDEGVLRRTHGGATIEGRQTIAPLSTRAEANRDEKERIGRKALEYVKEGDRIIIDGGTTTLQLALALKSNRRSASVVTNALNIALELAGLPELAIDVVGGTLSESSLTLIGPETERALARYRVSKVFLAASGITPEWGLGISNSFEAAVKQAMIEAADEVILLVDSTKLGKEGLVSFAPMKKVDRLITDEKADPTIIDAIARLGVDIEQV
jgi:DeoR/GlpR family transcriptional regulator of sugar metabolism